MSCCLPGLFAPILSTFLYLFFSSFCQLLSHDARRSLLPMPHHVAAPDGDFFQPAIGSPQIVEHDRKITPAKNSSKNLG